MQTRAHSLWETLSGRFLMLVIGATFSLWWIPGETNGSFLKSLWITAPYIILAVGVNYLNRRYWENFEAMGLDKLWAFWARRWRSRSSWRG